MLGLHRLLKLPWISEKDDAFCGLRDCEDVGERHLRRFIDKQRIKGVARIVSCPKPSGPRRDLTTGPNRPKEFAVVVKFSPCRLASSSGTF